MKKKEVTERLFNYVKLQKIKTGDKLPPERELSLLLNSSRTTIREVIRMLEERGFERKERQWYLSGKEHGRD